MSSNSNACASSPAARASALTMSTSGNPISLNFSIFSSLAPSLACSSVHAFAVALNSAMSSRYCLATTASCGSLGSGEDNSACRDNIAVLIDNAGDLRRR